MTFRHISELAGDVMRRLELEAGSEAAVGTRLARPATGFVAAAHLSGGEENSRLAQTGPEPAPIAQTELGKRTGANPGQVLTGEENVKQGQKSAVNLRVVSDNRRCLDTASRRRSKPRAPVVSRHLRLVWSEGHTILQRKITAQARMTKAPAPPSKTYT